VHSNAASGGLLSMARLLTDNAYQEVRSLDEQNIPSNHPPVPTDPSDMIAGTQRAAGA